MPLPLAWHVGGTPEDAQRLQLQRPDLNPLLAQVLASRGYEAGADLDAYLNSARGPEPDYTALPGMQAAVARVREALVTQERVVICGDYDIDGITATALLLKSLKQHGANVHYFLPQRQSEGYGLTRAALDELASEGTRLIITVDNGTTSLEEIAHAGGLGLDVIVTDHHLPGPDLPAAVALVNPQMLPEPGPLSPLSGVGVAYALARTLDHAHPVPGADARSLLDLAALGTLSDQAPLIMENRRLTHLGVAQLQRAPRRGLAALARVSKCNLRQVNLAETLSQKLIPRLNAAGRLANPKLALELLLTEDEEVARAIASQLEALNRDRRLLSLAIEAQALARVLGPEQARNQAIILWDHSWHQGVLGIVASRIAGHTRRPTLLLAPEGEGLWRGSGRSIPGFDLHAALQPFKSMLVRFGGHEQAVGLTIQESEIAGFIEAFQAAITPHLGSPLPKPKPWVIDAEVDPAELSYDRVATLAALEPTGPKNPAAVLGARRLRVGRQELRGPQQEHLWLELHTGNSTVEAIAFGLSYAYPLEAETIDIVFVPLAERFQGRPRLTLKVLELRPSEQTSQPD